MGRTYFEKKQKKRAVVSFIKIAAVLIICLLGILVYSNTLNVPFYMDDLRNIQDNPAIRNLKDIRLIWNFWPGRFITYLSFALNYFFHKTRLAGYHLVNLAIHLATAALVWWLMLLTFLAPRMKDKKISKSGSLIAFLAGLVFVAHPVQTQAVTYIVQRAASLATLFYLAALALYAKSRLSSNKTLKIIYYSAGLVSGILAMFTKEIAITLPLIILLYEFCFFKDKTSASLRRLIGFLLLLVVIPLTMAITQSVNFSELRRVDDVPIAISARHYLLTQFRVLITYIRLLFFPLNQNLDYDYPVLKSILQPQVLISLLFLTVIIAIAVKLFSKYRLLSFGIFWFFIVLLPESSILPINDVIFEHRLYLAMFGYCLFLSCGVFYLFQNKGTKPAVLVLFALVCVYAVLAYSRNKVWQDPLLLWTDTIRKSPGKARPYNNRGNVFAQRKDYQAAIDDYNVALRIDPYHVNAYYNRAFAYYQLGEYAKAINDYTEALRLKPDFFQAYNNRGAAYAMLGEYDKAIEDYQAALKINPAFKQASSNLQGRFFFKLPLGK